VRRGDETVTCPRLGSTVRVAHAPIITYEHARLERRNHSAGARRCLTAAMTSRAISSARSASGAGKRLGGGAAGIVLGLCEPAPPLGTGRAR
jgi:hypothetical protein